MSGVSGGPARPLRVAILGTRGIPARYGGFETFAERLALGLTQRGFEVTVYAEASDAPPTDFWHEGIRVRERRSPRWGPASTLAYDLACLWDARHQYDLVYMLGYGAAWACWLPRTFGTPVWINVDGMEWQRSKWGRFARFYLRAMEWLAPRVATRLIADARALARYFEHRYPNGAPCTCIAYGADLVGAKDTDRAVLDSFGLQAGQYHLLVARLEPENQIDEIITGFLQHGGALPLVIVGNLDAASPYCERLRERATAQVHFVGAIYDAAVLNALRVHATTYLHGHSVGGTNPSLLEALACGCWVLAHDNPFNREVAGDAADYFLQPADLAAAMRLRIQASQAEVDVRAARAREIIATRYSWQQVTDAYEAQIWSQVTR